MVLSQRARRAVLSWRHHVMQDWRACGWWLNSWLSKVLQNSLNVKPVSPTADPEKLCKRAGMSVNITGGNRTHDIQQNNKSFWCFCDSDLQHSYPQACWIPLIFRQGGKWYMTDTEHSIHPKLLCGLPPIKHILQFRMLKYFHMTFGKYQNALKRNVTITQISDTWWSFVTERTRRGHSDWDLKATAPCWQMNLLSE